MPSWGTVLDNLKNTPNPMDAMRRKYLGTMHKYTGRNIIAYYSAFVQKPRIDGTGIDDNDKNAFMQAVCGLDRSKGLGSYFAHSWRANCSRGIFSFLS